MNTNINPYFYYNNMLNGIDENAPIYKFMPLQYTLFMANNNLLTINRVSTWQDVYENYILKQEYQLQDGTPVNVVNRTDGVYGQCWTLCPENDAMWRIYSPNKDAIRIKTTVRKLFDALYLTDQNMADTFIGKVEYQSQAQIDSYVQALSSVNPQQFIIEMKKGAFIKRQEFAHEQEVRIIKILDSEQTRTAQPKLQFSIPNDFIEEYCIDPRADAAQNAYLRDRLIAAGVNTHLITRSCLYDFQSHSIVFE